MNKRQRIVQEAFLNNEEEVIKRLKAIYNQALKDITKKSEELQNSINSLTMATLQGDMDEEAQKQLQSMIQSKVYQKQYQDALKKQVSSILDNMQVEEFKSVSEYLNKCYEEGYLGTMYDLQGQGIPLIMPMDQEAMVRAVQVDSKISNGLYSRLGEDVTVLKKKITTEVSRGISTGMSFQQVAQQLAAYTNIGFNNAVRITRTEGHRIQVQSTNDACFKAKDAGADVVKQWDSSMDKRTRPSHQKVDGEIRELDEKFSNGLMFPGDPNGKASEVINCRCALLQRARWALDDDELDTLKERAEYFGIDKNDNFEDFKKKYLKAAEEVNVEGKVQEFESEIEKLTKENKEATLDWMMNPTDEGMQKAQDSKKRLDSVKEAFEKFKADNVTAIERLKKAKEAEVAGKKFDKITTAKEAKGKLLELGFRDVEDRISVLDNEMIVDATNQLADLEKKFGAIGKGKVTLTVSKKKNSNAFVHVWQGDSRSQELSFTQNFKKKKMDVIKIMKDAIEEKWHVAVAEGKHSVYTVTHEYGHIIENDILGELFSKLPQKEQDELSFDGLKLKLWRDEQGNKIRSEIVSIAKEMSGDPEFMSYDYVSKYGLSNCFEFFAEAFASSQLGKPNIIGDAMNEWLKKKGLILG